MAQAERRMSCGLTLEFFARVRAAEITSEAFFRECRIK
jgi:hypothetical protein